VIYEQSRARGVHGLQENQTGVWSRSRAHPSRLSYCYRGWDQDKLSAARRLIAGQAGLGDLSHPVH